MLARDFLDAVRDSVRLSDVVGRTVKLRRAGREMVGCCPFHTEKTPSFTVNDQKGIAHCFGCGTHHDVIGYMMAMERMTFLEVVEGLAARAGMAMPEIDPEQRRLLDRRSRLLALMDTAARYYADNLPAGGPARTMLAARGVTESEIARFRLGYAPAGSALLHHLRGQGFAEADIEAVGLLKRADDGRAFPFFRNRLMFPVTDKQGRVVAFGGRILEGDGPKYINSGATELFQKGSLLYGLSRLMGLPAGKPVVVVEGYLDVIAMHRAGEAGAVAPLGTAMTEAQIKAVWDAQRGEERSPILCFDGDAAGRRAAWRAIDKVLPLIEAGRTIRVAFMPAGEDPDSLIGHAGPEAMAGVLDGAVTLTEALWMRATEGRTMADPDSAAAVERSLRQATETIRDPGLRRRYWEALRERMQAVGAKPQRPQFTDRPQSRRVAPPTLSSTAVPMRERALMATILTHPELAYRLEEELAMARLTSPQMIRLRGAIMQEVVAGCESDQMREHLIAAGVGPIIEAALDPAIYRHAPYARAEVGLDAAEAGWREIITLAA